MLVGWLVIVAPMLMRLRHRPFRPAQVPAIFGAHPLVILYCKFDETIGALIGHDGFGWPATVRTSSWAPERYIRSHAPSSAGLA